MRKAAAHSPGFGAPHHRLNVHVQVKNGVLVQVKVAVGQRLGFNSLFHLVEGVVKVAQGVGFVWEKPFLPAVLVGQFKRVPNVVECRVVRGDFVQVLQNESLEEKSGVPNFPNRRVNAR